MRIFGGHDYYDCGMALGRDPAITLLRGQSESVPVEDVGGSLLSMYIEVGWGCTGAYLESVAVVLAGKVYRGVLAQRDGAVEGIWTAARLQAWVAQQKRCSIRLHGKWRGQSLWRFPLRSRRNKRTSAAERDEALLEQYFTPAETSQTLRKWMIDHRVSIMVERMPKFGEIRNFQINPTGLKSLGFAKAVDPYTAFQELSMWIGGVLGGTSPEIVEIKDDVVLAESHGFDKVTSFRGPRI